MQDSPTLGANCHLIGGKTVCNFQGTLMLTQVLLNLTRPVTTPTTPASAAVRSPAPPAPGTGDVDAHIDIVDDLSDYLKSRGGQGRAMTPNSVGPATAEGPKPTKATTSPAGNPQVDVDPNRGKKGDTGQPGPPGPPGICPDRCQLPLLPPSQTSPVPGPRGQKGEPGTLGPKGDQGVPGIGGRPGLPGLPGVCRPEQCAQGGPKGDRGELGSPGPRGPAGAKGEPGAGVNEATVRDAVRSEFQALQTSLGAGGKGEKGDPGSCGPCAARPTAAPSSQASSSADATRGRVIASTNVRVVKTYQAFTEISFVFEEGSLVFTKDERILYLKTDYRLNQWIEVANYVAKPKIHLGFPLPTTSPRRSPGEPQVFLPHVVTGRKIRLVALPLKLHGDLYYKSASSILGADYACHDAAMAAGLSKSYFKVFLSGQFSNLDTIVHSSQRADVPIVNFHGQKLFSSYSDLISRGAWNKEVQLQDFSGRNLSDWPEHRGSSEILAWQGLRQWQREATVFVQDCEGFTNRDPGKLGMVTNLVGGRLFQSREITCDSQQVTLCVEAFDENSPVDDPVDYRRR